MGCRYKTYKYSCNCPKSWHNGWQAGFHVESHPADSPPDESKCPYCNWQSALILEADIPRNTGGRQYPRYSPTCGKDFDTASDHRKFLKNPTDFKGRPLSLPDGTAIRYHEV